LTVQFALEQMLCEAPALAVVQQRFQHIEALLPARDLFVASLRLSTDNGTPRRKDVIRFEQCLLHYVDATGAWR
jgi:hypothetical protein